MFNLVQSRVGPDMIGLGDVTSPWIQNNSQELYATETVDPSAIMQNTYTVMQNSVVIPYSMPSSSYLPMPVGTVDLKQDVEIQKLEAELPNSQSSICSDDGIPSVQAWEGDYNFRFSVEHGATRKCYVSGEYFCQFCGGVNLNECG